MEQEKKQITADERQEYMATAAYYNYLKRIEAGEVGDADLDWDIAEELITDQYTCVAAS